MTTPKNIAVFGFAGNPPHNGHRDVIIRASESVDSVIVVPSYRHAFGKQMSLYNDRFALANALCDSLPKGVTAYVSDIEERIAKAKSNREPIYTYDVMEALQKEAPSAKLVFVIGPDNASPEGWAKFHRSSDIARKWGTLAISETIRVRSTQIRKKIAMGKLPDQNECPQEVITLLEQIYFEMEDASGQH